MGCSSRLRQSLPADAVGGVDHDAFGVHAEGRGDEFGIEGVHQAAGQTRHNERVPAPHGWTVTFTDLRHCAAIVDRLTLNGTTIENGTDSYRLPSTRARAEEPVKAS